MDDKSTTPLATTGLSALTLTTAAALTAFPALTIPGMLLFAAIVWHHVQP